jgi:hypothetical protein
VVYGVSNHSSLPLLRRSTVARYETAVAVIQSPHWFHTDRNWSFGGLGGDENTYDKHHGDDAFRSVFTTRQETKQ